MWGAAAGTGAGAGGGRRATRERGRGRLARAGAGSDPGRPGRELSPFKPSTCSNAPPPVRSSHRYLLLAPSRDRRLSRDLFLHRLDWQYLHML